MEDFSSHERELKHNFECPKITEFVLEFVQQFPRIKKIPDAVIP